MNVVARSILICTAAWCFSASAQESKPAEKSDPLYIKPVFAAGLTFSGDNIAEAEYDDESQGELKVGDLLDLRVGLQIDLPNDPVTIQTTFGFNFDSVTADNGEASLTRIPLELLAFYNIDKHRIGTGLAYHVNPALQLELADDFLNLDADNAFGLVVEYGYQVSNTAILGLRYLGIGYDFEGVSGELDGSHIGTYVYIIF